MEPTYMHLTSYVDDPKVGLRPFWLLLATIGIVGAALIFGAGAAAWY